MGRNHPLAFNQGVGSSNLPRLTKPFFAANQKPSETTKKKGWVSVINFFGVSFTSANPIR